MRRRLAIALAALVLLRGDMYQDAGNAKLPEARQNLQIDTVKSEGGAITRFYTWDQVNPQFEVRSEPEAAERGVEQAGKATFGATRLCYSDTSLAVNCNYVALGQAGKHVFGNGAGKMLELRTVGSGPPNAYPVLTAADDSSVRLEAESPGWPDIQLQLKAKGTSPIALVNGSGYMTLTPGTPAVIGAPNGVRLVGQVPPMILTAGAYSVPAAESGTHYHNSGSGLTTFTLPAASQGLNYCFMVDAGPAGVVVKASGSDKIAIAGANSVAGGQVAATVAYAGVCIEAHGTGQWVTIATPDKAQWTVS